MSSAAGGGRNNTGSGGGGGSNNNNNNNNNNNPPSAGNPPHIGIFERNEHGPLSYANIAAAAATGSTPTTSSAPASVFLNQYTTPSSVAATAARPLHRQAQVIMHHQLQAMRQTPRPPPVGMDVDESGASSLLQHQQQQQQLLQHQRSNAGERSGSGKWHVRTGSSWGTGGSVATVRNIESRLGCAEHDEHPTFFVPSYLRHSCFVQTLRRRYNTHIAELLERSSGHATGTGTTTASSWTPASAATGANQTSLGSKPSSGSTAHRSVLHEANEFYPLPPPPVPTLPSRWNEADAQAGLEILAEGSEVRFNGVTKTADDAASVRSNQPVYKECGVFYYEVTVLSRGKDGLIGVGLSSRKVPLNRPPGWEGDSWAYHGDDGQIYACSPTGKNYGPRFSANDVIGCGINFRLGTVFFTKNGVNIGTAFNNIKTDSLYPSIGVKKPGEHLRVNFGRQPFVFDIDTMVAQERASILKSINRHETTTLRPPYNETELVLRLVGQYLAHEGYVETATAFSQEVRKEREPLASSQQQQSAGTTSDWRSEMPQFLVDSSEDIHAYNRQKIRRAILDGEIDRALKYTNTFYPRVLEQERNRDIYFRLRCRKFIEMMRRYTELQTITSASSVPPTSRMGSKPANFDPSTDGHRHIDEPPAEHNGIAIGTNDRNSDTQMELDEQLHRESGPKDLHASLPQPSIHAARNGVATEDIDMDAGAPDTDDTGEMENTQSPSNNTTGHTTNNNNNENDHQTKQIELLAAALSYGQQLQSTFGSDPRAQVRRQLENIFAIMAYKDPASSVVGGLLDPKGRAALAEEVNAAILVSLGKPPASALEKVCAHTTWLLRETTAKKGGAPAFVNTRLDFMMPPSSFSSSSSSSPSSSSRSSSSSSSSPPSERIAEGRIA